MATFIAYFQKNELYSREIEADSEEDCVKQIEKMSKTLSSSLRSKKFRLELEDLKTTFFQNDDEE
jgi:hypothetical protein